MNSAIDRHATRTCAATGFPGRRILPAVPALPSPAALRARLAATPLSFAIAALNVAALAWVEGHGSSTDAATLVAHGALERGRVWAGEPWRLLTAAFLHAGWVHLAWNTAAGLPACRLVERAVGAPAFLLTYLASALAASALSLLGQDEIAAGASGALFGVVGAILALHRRALGSWRAFLSSGATRWLAGSILAVSVLGSLAVRLDHLAHAGGLGAGAAAAWLLSAGRRRALPWTAYAAALAALALAASWPRAELSRHEQGELESALHAALARGDAPAARRLVERADAAGHASDALGYYRALLRVQEGDLEGALAAARPLVAAPAPALAAEARRVAAGIAKTLAYRHYTGEGAPRDPRRALGYMDEACALGDEESCTNAARVRGR
jgi:membrane associated rhomboid family serine protease